MKTKVLITSLAVLFLGSLMLHAAEGDKPAPAPKDKPAARAKQGQKLNHQQRLDRWMAQINKAHEAKDYQQMERLIKQYAKAGRNRPGPAAGQRQMHQRRMNQQERPFAMGQGRQRPGRMQFQADARGPRSQAMGPRHGQPFRPEHGMRQQRGAQGPMPYAQNENFQRKMRRWAGNHPQEFRQFLHRYCDRLGRGNQEATIPPRANRPNPGYWRNFWADEF